MKLTDIASDAAGTEIYADLAALCFDLQRTGDPGFWDAGLSNADEYLRVARLEGLFPQVFERLAAFARESRDQWEELYGRWLTARQQMADAVREIGGTALVAKGYAIEAYYPPGRRRFFSDLDVVVPDLAALRELEHALARANYEMLPVLLVFWDEKTGQVCGVTRFRHADRIPLLGEIEVQIGIFPMSTETRVRYSDIATDARAIEKSGLPIYVADPIRQLAILIAEFESREKLKIRDVYDAGLIMDAAAPDAVPTIVELSERLGCERGLGLLREGIERLSFAPLPERLREFARNERVRRAKTKTRGAAHIWNVMRNVERVPNPVKATALRVIRDWAFALRARPKAPPLAALLDGAATTKRFFLNGIYCYARRADTEPGDFALLDAKGIVAFQSPVGTYLLRTTATFTAAAASDKLLRLRTAPAAPRAAAGSIREPSATVKKEGR